MVPVIMFLRRYYSYPVLSSGPSGFCESHAVFVRAMLFRKGNAVFCKTVFLGCFFFQILVVISIVMGSDSQCGRRSVSKANTTRMFEARARKKKKRKKKKKKTRETFMEFVSLLGSMLNITSFRL